MEIAKESFPSHDAVEALLNMSNEDLEADDSKKLDVISSYQSVMESDIATDNDKDSDKESKNKLHEIHTYKNNQEISYLKTTKSDEILCDKIRTVLAGEAINKKDLMRFEKYLEKNRFITTKLNDQINDEVNNNLKINLENFGRIEKFKADKASLWDMTWCGNTYIVCAFTLGFNYSCQTQINYKQRCMYMFPPRKENSNIMIKVELFRYLPISVYTSHGAGSEIILYSMSRISRRFNNQIDQ